MLTVISPAKTLDFESKPATPRFTQPQFLDHSQELIEQLREFSRIYNEIGNRIRIFLSLPLHKLDRMSLQRELNNIGLMQTSSVATQGEQ